MLAICHIYLQLSEMGIDINSTFASDYYICGCILK